MNRREAIKTAGAAFIASMAGPAAEAGGSNAGTQAKGGVFTVTFHGPSILHFPKDGSSARLHFTAFPHDSVCPQPVHIPMLKIDLTSAVLASPGKGSDDSWPIAGLAVEPMMEPAGKFVAVDFDQEPVPTKANPRVHPATDDEWKSLKWIPWLKVKVDLAKLMHHTTAAVSMNRGRLEATKPADPAAQTALWLMTTRTGWRSAEPNLINAPQRAITDRIKLIGRYSGNAAVLALRPMLDPTHAFEMRIKPLKDGGDVDVTITAEPPDTSHRADTRPLRLYCGYYNIAANPPSVDQRELPFLSPVDFSTKPIPPAPLNDQSGTWAQPTPSPLCGTMKIIP